MMSIWWWITEDLANSDIGIWGLENDGVIMVGSVPCKLLPFLMGTTTEGRSRNGPTMIMGAEVHASYHPHGRRSWGQDTLLD
jgi:hypothetical protein